MHTPSGIFSFLFFSSVVVFSVEQFVGATSSRPRPSESDSRDGRGKEGDKPRKKNKKKNEKVRTQDRADLVSLHTRKLHSAFRVKCFCSLPFPRAAVNKVLPAFETVGLVSSLPPPVVPPRFRVSIYVDHGWHRPTLPCRPWANLAQRGIAATAMSVHRQKPNPSSGRKVGAMRGPRGGGVGLGLFGTA